MGKSGFKLKSAASGGPMRRNFPSVFKEDEGSIQDNTRTPNVRTDIEVSDEQLSAGQIEALEDLDPERVAAKKAISKAAMEEANKKARKEQHILNVINYDKEMSKMRPNATKAEKIFKEMHAYRKEFPGSI